MAINFASGTLSGPTKLLQVVQDWDGAVDVRTGGTNGAWYTFGNLSASITPSSASSKILIMAHCTGFQQYDGAIRIMRSDGTVVGSNTLASSRPNAIVEFPNSPRWNETQTQTFMYLDSPGTTSARTYSIQAVWSGNTWYMNRTGSHSNGLEDAVTASNLILMEIGG
jgi:hypothetical protein